MVYNNENRLLLDIIITDYYRILLIIALLDNNGNFINEIKA